jgi:hypothetical protein
MIGVTFFRDTLKNHQLYNVSEGVCKKHGMRNVIFDVSWGP